MTDSLLHKVHAHQAITDVIYRYARAMDRMDAELALSCWHPGGTDDHAPLFKGTAEEFVAWLWPVHAQMELTRHVISNVTIEINGNKAGAESYWTVTLRMTDSGGKRYDIVGQGRYVDTLEYIGGIWAINHRRSIHDWDRIEEVGLTMSSPNLPVTVEPNNLDAEITPSVRNRSDYSYSVLDAVRSS